MTAKRLFVGRKTVEDRFTIINDYENEIGVKENRSGDVIVLKHSDLNAQQFVAQLVVFLNDQNQAIVDLYDGSKFWSDKATERIKELEEENEQLKFERDRYKRLSEIRQESINNRILTIKEFIDNCSDKEVKKTLEQLFHSEVKGYDLSKKIRKLEKENEQLKCGNKNLKATLNDFINILNRLQSNPTDKQILAVARDMLQNMGKEVDE